MLRPSSDKVSNNDSKKFLRYGAEVTWSEPDTCWYGILTGISDFVDFEADTVADIEREFHTVVDFYIDWIRNLG